ncbi:RhoGEF-domain-containing protein [Gigaspora margarita]|uniref:RhoGEF-domain-containing protein n=1 Tax=Gigaspora margarita TaxID=4874 RepID=A0A8H4AIE7_GIGMA|nr:RhoGEF-domain-containing protein [Gigaspora margarita]
MSRVLKRTPSQNNISSIEAPSTMSANTLNRPAQASQSLYPQCQDLLGRLYCVEGFEQYLIQGQNSMQSNGSIVGTPTSENGPSSLILKEDPVTLLWQTFRLGYPLCALFNAFKPKKPLKVSIEDSKPKACVYNFLVACREEFQLKPEQIFSITQLFQDDTNGFVMVINTVKLVTDKIEEKGLLNLSRKKEWGKSDSKKPTDNRARVVHELLETERKYVQDMEALQNYARELRRQDIVSADTIHLLFANLNQLVDFQRRFLIGVEATSSASPEEQRFGTLFIQMEENFAVYEPFCANYVSASDLVIQELPSLQKLSHVVEPTYELPSLLIKPIQRICKYPLLLQELLKFTDKEDKYYDEIKCGLNAIKRVADRVNETRRQQENAAVVKDLERRVEDWKGHKIEQFGELLLEDVFTMSKDDSEREYHVYLFEKILLCCKETNSKKQQSKSQLLKNNNRKLKRTSLQLKGRIFIHNITAAVENRGSDNGRSGVLSLRIYWRGDSEMESFSLKCRNEEQLKQWKSTLEKLLPGDNNHRHTMTKGQLENTTPTLKRTGVSNTQLASLQNLDLPYFRRDGDTDSFIEDEDDYDDDDDDESDDYVITNNNNNNNNNKLLKSQSLPYGQFPAPYNDKGRPKTNDSVAPPPYNGWDPNSPPLPNIHPQHRSHSSSSLQTLSRNGNSTAPPTMANFPSNPMMQMQMENMGYPNSPPPSYPGSPAPSTRSSTTSHSSSNPVAIWQRRSVEHPSPLAGTIAKFMKDDDEYNTLPPPPPPIQRSHSHSAAPGQTFNQVNGPAPNLIHNHNNNHNHNVVNRLRSQSSPNIQAIQELQFESMEPVPSLPNSSNLARQNVTNGEIDQRNSASSNSSQTSGHSQHTTNSTNLSTTNNNTLLPTQSDHKKQHSLSNYSTTMKIKVNFAEDVFVIVVPQDIEYRELCDRVERKIRLCSTRRDESVPIRIRYQDEDGDHITINSDEDVSMAFEGRLAAGGNFVNLYVS